MKPYSILMHPESYRKAENYMTEISSKGIASAGNYFKKQLMRMDLSVITVEEFIEHLAATKRTQIFAESAVYGDGKDWNLKELSILGDIGVAVSVTVYDDGKHYDPRIHKEPFPATLLYTPGALLRNGTGNIPADIDEVTKNGQIDITGYRSLYERRLLPLLIYANDMALSAGNKALVTIPGLGCGQFAGKFSGQLGEQLKQALIQLLTKYAEDLVNIKVVYYDPFQECGNERVEIGHISFMVRPLNHGNQQKPQLCKPVQYQEAGDDFSDCQLFSFVAWDHVSWPGNDFYIGSRSTDDGVKAAATSSMTAMTGVQGVYNNESNMFNPPDDFEDWEDVVIEQNLYIAVNGNLSVLPFTIDGKLQR